MKTANDCIGLNPHYGGAGYDPDGTGQVLLDYWVWEEIQGKGA